MLTMKIQRSPKSRLPRTLLSVAMLLSFAAVADEHDHDPAEDSIELRAAAAAPVHWESGDHGKYRDAELRHLKILAFNDFHGHISASTFVAGRHAGGAAVLSSYLRAAQAGIERETVIANAGDNVGASPLSSALLADEPTIMFYNQLVNDACRRSRYNEHCNFVSTLGNHEFDQGSGELGRLLNGGNSPKGPFLQDPYLGAQYPSVNANVVDAASGKPLIRPYVIKEINDVKVAFIGAVLRDTPSIVTPTGVAGLRFLDEAEAVNHYVPIVKAQGAKVIVVLIHQGGSESSYSGPTKVGVVSGDIVGIVSRLSDAVDVVVSGHTHSFTNALLPTVGGKQALVTQAFSFSTAYADIDLQVAEDGGVVSKTASVVTTFADVGPGLTPDAAAAALTAQAELQVAPLANQVIGTITADITRTQNAAGESALGNLIADAQRSVEGSDFAFMNPGGIRADLLVAQTHNPALPQGTVTYGDLFTVQPFGNSLVKMTMTGQQVYTVLEQQFPGLANAQVSPPRFLQVSGLSYVWDSAAPAGSRIVEVRANSTGRLLDKTASYSVTVNSFLAAGGDRFLEFANGANKVGGPLDIDALIQYVKAQPQPTKAAIDGRISRL
jgi:5'-nucleotidase